MAARPLLLTVLALGTLLVQALADTIWGLPGFTRVHCLSSLVLNNVLYLDGGEIFNGTNVNHVSEWTMGSTVMISLDVPWSTANVSITAIDKPKSFPYAEQPFIWYNTVEENIQSFGGMIYFYGNHIWRVASQEVLQARTYIPSQKLWELHSGVNQWVRSAIQPPGNIGVLQNAARVATDAAFYSMGSCVFIDPNYTTWAESGLIEFDFKDGNWYNRSTRGYGPKGSSILAESVYTSLFGSDGVIIYIGGYTMEYTKAFRQGDHKFLQDMSEILMWDIGRKRMISQRTTGSKPPSRWACVTVGVSEAGSDTFDIFVHGGFRAKELNEVFEPDIANVYVLSIPSFVWTQIPESTATMRGFGTAQVIGRSQMVIVGGNDATQPSVGVPVDPWDNAIGLFDLNSWRWTMQYRPDAEPYKRAATLVEVSKKTPYAKFDSPEVAMVFNPNGRETAPEVSNNAESGNSINAGAIAGGVVGGAVALGVALAWFFIARRKKKSNETATEIPPYQEESQDMNSPPRSQMEEQEVDDSGRKYKLVHKREEQWEIRSSPLGAERYEIDKPPRATVKRSVRRVLT